MLKHLYLLLALVLCIPLIFAGCEKAPTDHPTEQESETESRTEADETSEPTTEKPETTDNYIHADFYSPGMYFRAKRYLVVRWGRTVGKNEAFSELTHYEDYKDLMAVEVEVTRLIESPVAPYLSYPEKMEIDRELKDLNKIYLPEEALSHVVEGETSLVVLEGWHFLEIGKEQQFVAIVEGSQVPNSATAQGEENTWLFPIFGVGQDQRLGILESQWIKNDRKRYVLEFLDFADLGNSILQRMGDSSAYLFRHGMTIDQFEQFLYLTAESRP